MEDMKTQDLPKINKKEKSSKSKVVLTVVGIILGSFLAFGLSFIFSFGYLINPSVITIGGGKSEKLEEENAELKAEVEFLESKVESLEAKSKSSAYTKSTQAEEPKKEEKTESEATVSETEKNKEGGSLHSAKTDSASAKPQQTSQQTSQQQAQTKTDSKKTDTSSKTIKGGGSTSSKFEAKTTVTPKDDAELTEPASEEITVVEID